MTPATGRTALRSRSRVIMGPRGDHAELAVTGDIGDGGLMKVETTDARPAGSRCDILVDSHRRGWAQQDPHDGFWFGELDSKPLDRRCGTKAELRNLVRKRVMWAHWSRGAFEQRVKQAGPLLTSEVSDFGSGYEVAKAHWKRVLEAWTQELDRLLPRTSIYPPQSGRQEGTGVSLLAMAVLRTFGDEAIVFQEFGHGSLGADLWTVIQDASYHLEAKWGSFAPLDSPLATGGVVPNPDVFVECFFQPFVFRGHQWRDWRSGYESALQQFLAAPTVVGTGVRLDYYASGLDDLYLLSGGLRTDAMEPARATAGLRVVLRFRKPESIPAYQGGVDSLVT